MNSKNELLAVLKDGENFKIITTKGALIISEEDVKIIIEQGEFPLGIKNSPLIEGIPLKLIYKEISKISKKTIKKKEEPPEKQAIAYKTRFTYDDYHYNEFLDPVDGKFKFIKYRNETILGETESVIIPDPDEPDKEVIVKPAPQVAQTKTDRIFDEDEFDFVKFPPRPISYGALNELYIRIKAFVHKYVEVREEDEVLVTLWILKAILSDVLKDMSFPFVHIIAPFGHGKSRLLLVMTEITPYGFYLINIGSAPLKRVSQLYSPILYVDEKASMDSDTAAIINAKFNKNSVILNADNEVQRGINSVIGYKIFGPLALASRTPFKDDAIESKAFQISQDFELTRKDIPRKIKGKLLDEFEKEAREIRGQLLQFRIDYHDKINEVKSSGFIEKFEEHLEPRLYEILSFFEDLIEIIPSIKREIFELLKYQIKRNVEVAMETPNGIVASTFLSVLENSEEELIYSSGGRELTGIRLADIYYEIGSNYSKQAGKILQSLGLITDRPRIETTDSQGNPIKKRITVVRIPDEKKLNELKARYDSKYVEEVLIPRIEQDIQASLDEEDDQDYQKEKVPSDNTNNERKEGVSQNERSHSPLRPDSSQELGQTEKNDSSEVKSQRYHEWNYFKILENFDLHLETGKKFQYMKGNVSKFPVVKAGEYISKGLIKSACPNGHWDPNSHECIVDIGGNNE